ncbi:MAG: hypothetical protein ACR2MO_07250 [Acidimicrobiales bacterium]
MAAVTEAMVGAGVYSSTDRSPEPPSTTTFPQTAPHGGATANVRGSADTTVAVGPGTANVAWAMPRAASMDGTACHVPAAGSKAAPSARPSGLLPPTTNGRSPGSES